MSKGTDVVIHIAKEETPNTLPALPIWHTLRRNSDSLKKKVSLTQSDEIVDTRFEQGSIATSGERAQNQVASKGYNVATASTQDKLYHELLLEAAACHLIADWKGVVFVEDGKEIEPPCTLENATKLLNMGDIGFAIWMFVKVNAEKIQADADAIQAETVGKSLISTNGTQETEG